MASSGALSDMVFLGLEDDVLGGDKPTSDGRCEDLTAYDQSPVGAIAPCLTPSRQLRRVSLPNPCTRSPADLGQAAINRFWSAPMGDMSGAVRFLQRPSGHQAAVNAADLRRKHFHALNGERLTCFDAYESLLHRT